MGRLEDIIAQHKHDITTAYARGGLELEIQTSDKLAIEAIKSLMDSVLGADEPIDGNDSTDYRNELRAELRERIKSL